jgi:hypothetical protein
VFKINFKPVIGIGVEFRGLQALRADNGKLQARVSITHSFRV